MVLTLGQIASELGAELHGDASVEVSRIANLETAGEAAVFTDKATCTNPYPCGQLDT